MKISRFLLLRRAPGFVVANNILFIATCVELKLFLNIEYANRINVASQGSEICLRVLSIPSGYILKGVFICERITLFAFCCR